MSPTLFILYKLSLVACVISFLAFGYHVRLRIKADALNEARYQSMQALVCLGIAAGTGAIAIIINLYTP